VPYENTAEWWEAHGDWSSRKLAAEYGGDPANWRTRRRKAVAAFKTSTPTAADPVGHIDYQEILNDGAYRSTKLLEMDDEQCKSKDFMLTAHGFSVDEWEIVTAKNKTWNVFSDKGGVRQLYSSCITVKPLVNGFNIEAVIAAVRQVEAVRVKRPTSKTAGMLEIPPFDAHFGNSYFDDYEPSLERIVALIEQRKWDEVLFPIGSDLFHNNGLRNQTASGTVIEGMDYPRAWADAVRFYRPQFEAALRQACRVIVRFIPGNHDEFAAWAFCQTLQAMFPQIEFDLEIRERKVHTYGDVCIGFTHGDKARKEFDRIFLAEFPEFATAKVREIHTGHYHHETSKDEYGVMVRSLSTANRLDKWHTDQGYVGANRRFTVFDFSKDSLTSIHYV
jgi:hypothetical protein